MESKIKTIKQLILKSDLDNKTYSFNVSDIVAIIPKEQEIVVMTKGGKSTAVKSYIPDEDVVRIFFRSLLPIDDDLPFENRKHGFVQLSDHSIINVDEITNMNLGGKGKKELNIGIDNKTIKVNKDVDIMHKYLNHIKELRNKERSSEGAEWE